jgi:hypothetical protein
MTPNSQGVTRFEPIRSNGYVAELFSSPWSGGLIFHYVIQREGDTNIIHFGQEVSEQRAREVMHEILEMLIQKSASRSA